MNQLGVEPDNPAGTGETAETAAWTATLLEVVRGEAILPLYAPEDRRTRALAETYAKSVPYWVAFRARVTNNREGAAFLPPTAWMPVDPAGAPQPDVLTLTPPNPDLAGPCEAGVAREGWFAFCPPDGDEIGKVVRFLPFRTDPDPRFFSLAGTGGSGEAPPGRDPIPAGATAVTTEAVNLRAAPSTGAALLAELPAGTALTVTGDRVDGDGRSWYPVEDPATGASGYVAADYLTLAA